MHRCCAQPDPPPLLGRLCLCIVPLAGSLIMQCIVMHRGTILRSIRVVAVCYVTVLCVWLADVRMLSKLFHGTAPKFEYLRDDKMTIR